MTSLLKQHYKLSPGWTSRMSLKSHSSSRCPTWILRMNSFEVKFVPVNIFPTMVSILLHWFVVSLRNNCQIVDIWRQVFQSPLFLQLFIQKLVQMSPSLSLPTRKKRFLFSEILFHLQKIFDQIKTSKTNWRNWRKKFVGMFEKILTMLFEPSWALRTFVFFVWMFCV